MRKSLLFFIFCFCITVKVMAQAPVISSISQLNAPVGTVLTLSGSGFNTTAPNNVVFFGAVATTASAATASSLTVTVPPGASYGQLTVVNTANSLSGSSMQQFNPTFSPNKGSITSADISLKTDFGNFGAASSPYSVAIGDLDGDGKPDLVVTDIASQMVSVLRNTSSNGSLGAGSFASKVDFATGISPHSVSIGDLDGDAKLDLVVANTGSATVSVLRNTATSGSITAGSFAPKVDFTAGSSPESASIGDMDGDGKPDLTVVNSNSNTVSVLRNTSSSGSLTFAAKVDFVTGNGPYSVSIGDLDGDGKPDLVAVNTNSNTVSVFRNISVSGSITAGSFAAKVDFTTGIGPFSVSIGDLDGDGKPELVVANVTNNSVSVLHNTSVNGSITAGSFAPKVDFATGAQPRSVAIGDLNGDGKPDLAVANSGGNTVSVLHNTSVSGSLTLGSFAARVNFSVGTYPNCVSVGDLDGDGKPDLAVVNYSSRTVSVLRNNPQLPPPVISGISQLNAPVGTTLTLSGSGFNTTAANNMVFFGAVATIASAATASSLTVTVPVGASYGPLNVLNTGTNRSGVSTLYFNPTFSPNKGSITAQDIAPKVDFTAGTGPSKITIGDVDADGKPDLVTVNLTSNTVSVLRNISSNGSLAAGSFAAKVDFPTGNAPTSVAIGDVDGDGKPDLAITNYYDNTVSVLRNTGSTGNIAFVNSLNFSVGPGANSVAIGDLVNNDGKPDLAIVWRNASTNNIMVLANASSPGTISFGPGSIYSAGSDAAHIAVADMDGDGRLDLLVANRGSDDISVLRRNGNSFATALSYTVGLSPWSLTIGDLDGDGKPDVAVANEGSETVSVLRNTGSSGSIAFAPVVDFNLASGPFSIAVGDVDGDGKPDLVTTHRNDNSISLLRNTSTINTPAFAAAIKYATGVKPYSIAVADLNADGKPDLATANFDANSISVLRNDPQYQQPQTITAPANITRIYGDADFAPGATASSGLEVAYASADNSIAEAYQDAADANKWKLRIKKAGRVSITASQGGNASYFPAQDVIFDLIIDKKTVTVTAAAKSKTYGETDPALTYTHSPALLTGDTFIGSLSRATGEQVGSYTIGQGTLTAGNNYTVNYTGADLVIGRKAVTVTAQAKSKTYGEADPALTYTHAPALVAGDTFIGSLSRASGEQVGSYTIGQGTLTAGNNYTVNYTGAELTIGSKAVTVTVQPKSKIYGEADPSLTYTSTGLTGNDALTGSLARSPGEDAGTYTIGQGTLGAGANYTLTLVTAVFNIDKTVLTVTAVNAGLCQGSSLPPFVVSYSGFRRGDTENSLAVKPVVTTVASASSPAGSYALTPGGAAAANYTFVYVNGSLNISSLQTISISSDKGSSISKGQTVVLSIPASASYSWTGPDILSGQSSRSVSVRPQANAVYTVTVTNAQGCSQSASFSLTVREDFQVVTAKNILSPNGDGYNDTWVVDNIDYYPNNTVTIFDRNSRIVYTKQKYDNSWDGQFNGSALPGGTYYYIIDYGSGKGQYKGFITLVR